MYLEVAKISESACVSAILIDSCNWDKLLESSSMISYLHATLNVR